MSGGSAASGTSAASGAISASGTTSASGGGPPVDPIDDVAGPPGRVVGDQPDPDRVARHLHRIRGAEGAVEDLVQVAGRVGDVDEVVVRLGVEAGEVDPQRDRARRGVDL